MPQTTFPVCCCRGNAYLDQAHTPLLEHPDAAHRAAAPEAAAPILDVLLGRLCDLTNPEDQVRRIQASSEAAIPSDAHEVLQLGGLKPARVHPAW